MKSKIKSKALSVNCCWQGRRFKTARYKDYEEELFYLLPPKIKIYKKNRLEITFGFSSKLSDIDNAIKPFVDILQKKYLFNDRTIYYLEVEKRDVKKNEEFIAFEMFPMV